MRLRRRARLAAALSVIFAIAGTAQADADCDIGLQFIGEHAIGSAAHVGPDAIGGISGIDYDPRTDLWYLVSDDRTHGALARFFIARFHYAADRVGAVDWVAAQRLRDPAAIDAETIRVEPLRGSLLVAGEGDVMLGHGAWLQRVDSQAQLIERIALPGIFTATAQRGPRANKSIEGMTFAPDGRTFWIALETALLQDGPTATAEQASDARVTHLTSAGAMIAQYVYRTDAAHAHRPGESSDNGISEILALHETQLLILERSGLQSSTGFRFHTRLYCASTVGATDVAAFDSLIGRNYRVLKKRLLLDFDTLPQASGNLEAMSWGRTLAGGRRSLVLASDNNFFTGEPTRLLFFSVR